MKKFVLLIVLMMFSLAMQPVQAKAETILFVPADNRPVSLEYVVDTARNAGVNLLTPPNDLLGSRTSPGNPDALWDWVFNHSQEADAIVVSGDSMLYGSLVGSRKHNYSEEVLQQRMDRFAKLKQLNPFAPLYVYATIMRTSRASFGGVEPAYYEKYGPSIFQITALEDKSDLEPLSRSEQSQLQTLLQTVPQEVMSDWMARRAKNYKMDVRMINYTKNDTFDYLILGRDDCSPFSQSHKESRLLSKVAQGLPTTRYTSFPGADQLGMLLVTRAINNLNWQLPFIQVKYAPGAGPETVPTYEDKELGETIPEQITAAGGIMLQNAVHPDLILEVNTPANGKTLEAGNPVNQNPKHAKTTVFTERIGQELTSGANIAVADVAFANGADNALMDELDHQKLLPKLAAYSGWNTAGNTIGYAIGQGILAAGTEPAAKDRLLAVRLLDDWAYQANIRNQISDSVLSPLGGSPFYLNGLAPQITAETQRKMQNFATDKLQDFDIHDLKVTYPWNRMFEVNIELK
ncbi:Hypothetical protein LUCI_3083 [Lucifera butyrica]|uniref:DUF4127 domain-containing protein n=1 Tax=Lucifera butyrica TaxID=1351585 RepID=A0A498RFE1_9FIRM|nr:DUF4127 family protein [Lucifera butyrica]VBB07818.1 Hypothetical protein LUCI_3083 [Lucifera butyrica]